MKKVLALTFLFYAVAFSQSPSPLVIPHIADGGGWKTSIAIYNGFSNDIARISVIFRNNDGQRILVPVSNYGMVSSIDLEMMPESSVYLETLGTGADVQTGWVEVDQLTSTTPIRGFAVFRQIVPGRPNFEAVSIGMRAAQIMTFPFDNTNGLVTGFAAVNLGPGTCTVAVSSIFDEKGSALLRDPRLVGTLQTNGHMSFVGTDRIPELVGRRGYLTFQPRIDCGTGGMAMLGLRFTPDGPFTNLLPLNVTAADGR